MDNLTAPKRFAFTNILRWFTAVSFVAVGTTHFTHTDLFLAIMPPWIPGHLFSVLFSGAAEIAGGIGLLIPQTRKAAAWGILALLVMVFPANIHMAVNKVYIPGTEGGPEWALWARLPMQFVMAVQIWWVGLRKHGA